MVGGRAHASTSTPTTPSCWTARTRSCPTRARGTSRTGCTAARAPSTSPGSRGRTRAGGAFRWPGRCSTRLHVGTFTPEGTFDAAIGKLAHLADLGVDAVELLPCNAFPGERGWGYDGVGLYAVHEPYGGPSGLLRLRQRRPRLRHRSGDGRRLQPPRPGRELPGALRALLHRHARHPVGGGGQPRRPALRRGARVPARQPADVGARLPRRRHPPRRGARAARRPGGAHPGGARDRGGSVVGARRQAAVPHRRDRPEQPAVDPRPARPAGSARTRSGATTSTTPCTRRSPASGRATTATSARCPRWPRP